MADVSVRRIQERGVPPKKLLRELREASKDDLHFRDGTILGSMCTEPLPIARRAHSIFLEANLGNPGYDKGTWRLERETTCADAEPCPGSAPA